MRESFDECREDTEPKQIFIDLASRHRRAPGMPRHALAAGAGNCAQSAAYPRDTLGRATLPRTGSPRSVTGSRPAVNDGDGRLSLFG